MNKTVKNCLRLSIILFIFSLTFSNVISQNTEEKNTVNQSYENGSVVISENAKLKGVLSLSQEAYDERIIGVYISEGSQTANSNNKRIPVRNEGIVNVKFNSENGPIRKGDPVTSSSTPGVAMKATQSGIILGIAVEDASIQSGFVKVRVLIQYLKQ